MSRKTASEKVNSAITDHKIKEFIDHQKPQTAKTYRSFFRTVVKYSSETGDQMLKNPQRWSKKLLEIKNRMSEDKYSLGTIQAILGMVRGYFSFYHVDLELSRADQRKLNEKARDTEDYLFSRDDLKKMVQVANIKEKYVLLVGCSLGLRAEDFCSLTYGRYRLAIEKADKENLVAPLSIGRIETMKEKGVVANSFLSSDAVPIIRTILETNKESKDSEKVWSERSAQLTVVLQNLAHKTGIDPHESRIRFHNLRKYLFDRLSANASQEYAKMIIGKKVSDADAPYLNVDRLRETYLKAQPDIIIKSNGNGITPRVVELERQLAEANRTIEELKSNGIKALAKMFLDEKKDVVQSELKDAKLVKSSLDSENVQPESKTIFNANELLGLKALLKTFEKLEKSS